MHGSKLIRTLCVRNQSLARAALRSSLCVARTYSNQVAVEPAKETSLNLSTQFLQVLQEKSSVISANVYPTHLQLSFTRNNKTVSSDFKWFWLRHNCNCFRDEATSHVNQKPCHHPKTRERLLDSSEIPLNITPHHVCVSPDSKSLQIQWKEGDEIHHTSFPFAWLRENMNETEVENPRLLQFPPSDVQQIEIDYTTLINDLGVEQGTREYKVLLKKKMLQYGAVVVRNRGFDTEEIIQDLLPGDADCVPSHFGRIEDLRTDNTTNSNNDQLGYTNVAVLAHTDLPFVLKPPTAQVLHCMRKAEEGGDNILVDGFQAALFLRRQDRVAYDLLRNHPVTFHRLQKNYEASLTAPIISMGTDEFSPEKFQVRFSYFTMAPHKLPFSVTDAWYAAYNKFTQIVRNPFYSYSISLEPGDYILYNNYRMLHGRTGFQGSRWMRGVYFRLDQVFEALDHETDKQ